LAIGVSLLRIDDSISLNTQVCSSYRPLRTDATGRRYR
jgi:hypothetical protein